MGARISWVQNDRVLLIHFWGVLNAVEIQEKNDYALKILEASTSDIVHIIIDVSQVTDYPRYFSRLLWSFSVFQKVRSGYITTVTKDNLLRVMLGSVGAAARGRRIRNFPMLANAVRFLQAQDVEIHEILYEDCLRSMTPIRGRGKH